MSSVESIHTEASPAPCKTVDQTMSPAPSKPTDLDQASTVKKKRARASDGAKASKKPKTYTSVPKTLQGVKDLIKSWGYEEPDRASLCAMAGMARGNLKVDFDAKLDSIAWTGQCVVCKSEIQTKLRALLDQSDCGGDYDMGCEGGGLVCSKEGCHYQGYLTDMCGKNMCQDDGTSHNHCTECKGFGRCLGDLRTSHCSQCGKHYFAGYTGFDCDKCSRSKSKGSKSKKGSGRRGDDECLIM